jgi:hypothetical protein
MAKSIKKRVVKTVKKVTHAPAPVREAEPVIDVKPIDSNKYDKIKIKPSYVMVGKKSMYNADSWLGLGWTVLRHCLWHLDEKPIDSNKYDKIKIAPSYIMECEAGVYHAKSWLGLGWAIFTHRLWHLWNDGSFKD